MPVIAWSPALQLRLAGVVLVYFYVVMSCVLRACSTDGSCTRAQLSVCNDPHCPVISNEVMRQHRCVLHVCHKH